MKLLLVTLVLAPLFLLGLGLVLGGGLCAIVNGASLLEWMMNTQQARGDSFDGPFFMMSCFCVAIGVPILIYSGRGIIRILDKSTGGVPHLDLPSAKDDTFEV